MYSLSEQLFEQYAFPVTEIQKGRGAYICTSEENNVIIKEFDTSEVRAEFMAAFLAEAADKGILADRIIRTTKDTVLATDVDETRYYVRNYIEGRECEVKNRDDLLAAVTLLAQFHQALHQGDTEVPDGLRIHRQTLLTEYGKHNRELKKVRNYIRGKKSKNEFEMLFLRNYDNFAGKAEQVTDRLKRQMETISDEEWERYSGICHGDFNQHNVLFAKDGVHLTNLENAVYDMYIRDLANFMRKMMEKHNWNVGLAVDMTAAYETKRKLTPVEYEQLYIRLSYPEKFWKIANHYYNSNKSWISGRNIEKLNRVIEQEEQREHFLRILFNFRKE